MGCCCCWRRGAGTGMLQPVHAGHHRFQPRTLTGRAQAAGAAVAGRQRAQQVVCFGPGLDAVTAAPCGLLWVLLLRTAGLHQVSSGSGSGSGSGRRCRGRRATGGRRWGCCCLLLRFSSRCWCGLLSRDSGWGVCRWHLSWGRRLHSCLRLRRSSGPFSRRLWSRHHRRRLLDRLWFGGGRRCGLRLRGCSSWLRLLRRRDGRRSHGGSGGKRLPRRPSCLRLLVLHI